MSQKDDAVLSLSLSSIPVEKGVAWDKQSLLFLSAASIEARY